MTLPSLPPPRLRDVLASGGSPADVIGAEWLADIVASAALQPPGRWRRLAVVEYLRTGVFPVPAMTAAPPLTAYDHRRLATLAAWEVELADDPFVFSALLALDPALGAVVGDALAEAATEHEEGTDDGC